MYRYLSVLVALLLAGIKSFSQSAARKAHAWEFIFSVKFVKLIEKEVLKSHGVFEEIWTH